MIPEKAAKRRERMKAKRLEMPRKIECLNEKHP
jgi:hypothetical protein